MSISNIPVVIIHRTYKDYLKVNLQITGLNNKIILIGDDQLENLSRMDNVTFVNINKYENLPLLKESYANFTNFSSNNKTFEWICFERVFILKFFMKEFKLNHVFHIDSDNILFDNINNYPFEKAIAYCICTNWRQYRMSNSIHCGLLNEEFCEKFIGLFNDIYVNKSKLFLIKDKINHHKDDRGRFHRGGICDMTLYYLLANEKMIDVQNLLNPVNNIVFINNINNAEGVESENQFELDATNKMNIQQIDNKYMVHDKMNNRTLRLFNIHFQGSAKKLLCEFKYKNTFTPLNMKI